MERDFIEGTAKRNAPVRKDDEGTAPAAHPALPIASAVGNRAFAKAIQRSAPASQGAGPLDEEIATDIDARRGAGAPLQDDLRTEMEDHLGADLSGVRVHTDSASDTLNRSVQAEAFTTGQDVFFSSGKYDPGSSSGKSLLAHELTHVVQQSAGQGVTPGEVSHPNDSAEVEAKALGDAIGSAPAAVSAAPTAVAREEVPEEEEEPAMAVARQEAPAEEELEDEEAPTL